VATQAKRRVTRRRQSPLEQLRTICLEFPEAHEVEAWGEPTFRVKNKLFAMYASWDTHHGGGRPSVWVKSTHVNQDLLVRLQPARFFVPPYVGPSGWVGIYLDKRPSWKTIGDILRDAYLLIAPKKTRAQMKR
jgi:predicted DNA-binding protein (MmcQ/YjbR family)